MPAFKGREHTRTHRNRETGRGDRVLFQGAAQKLIAVDGGRDALASDGSDLFGSRHAAATLQPNLFPLGVGLSQGHHKLDRRPRLDMLITNDEIGAGRNSYCESCQLR